MSMELNALLLGLIQDIHILLALKLLCSIWGLKSDLVMRGDALTLWHGVHHRRHRTRELRQAVALHWPAMAMDRLRRHSAPQLRSCEGLRLLSNPEEKKHAANASTTGSALAFGAIAA
eukprot:CAMPEP_0197886022 /NCGR_PEP_ID=MMETSP1439-20131203/15805_1 /TAXON_ID=66791 /ORGANISM="Gonyaulax spinifera, Strain CCMP409" /LENGTH=117 /DNA_ID=CAMNT_0043505785 /DNA_START=290 /DNA_END=645 /DNA_ORIENTATION=+